MTQNANPQGSGSAPRRLQRTKSGRMIAGVCSGVGAYFGIDANIVRVVLVLLTIIWGSGLVLYVAGWLLLPEEGEDRSVAQRLLKQ